jgi:hypothetical protein
MIIEKYYYFCTGVIRVMKAVVLLTMVISHVSPCIYEILYALILFVYTQRKVALPLSPLLLTREHTCGSLGRLNSRRPPLKV